MSRVSKLKQDLPEDYERPEVFDLADQADQLQDLKAIADQPGGKQLINLLLKDVVHGFHRLTGSYKEASHLELLALIADMNAHLTTAKLLLNSKAGMEVLDQELEEILSE